MKKTHDVEKTITNSKRMPGPGAPKRPPENRRSERRLVALTPEEFKRCQAFAESRGLKMSELFRVALFDYMARADSRE